LGSGPAAVEPDPRAGERDMLLDTALRAATAAQRDATTAALISAGEQLRQAGEEIDGFFRLAEASWAAGRRGRDDLN